MNKFNRNSLISLYGITNSFFFSSHLSFYKPVNSFNFFSTKTNNNSLNLYSLFEREEINLNLEEFKCKQYILILEYLKLNTNIFISYDETFGDYKLNDLGYKTNEKNINEDRINKKYKYLFEYFQYIFKTNKDIFTIDFIINLNKILSSIDEPSIVKDDQISFNVDKQLVFFDNSPIYEAIKQILNECKHYGESQSEIEYVLNYAWIETLNSKIDKFKDNPLVSENFTLLHKHVTKFNKIVKLIKLEKKNSKKKNDFSLKPLFELDDTTISSIVFNNVIPILHISEGLPRNQIIIKIGKDLFNQWAYMTYKKNKKNSDELSFKEYKASLNIDVSYEGNIGDLLLHYLVEDSSLVKLEIKKFADKQESWIVASSDGIKNFKNCFEIIGFKLPMICVPREWGPNKFGGYLLNEKYQTNDLIHQSTNNVSSSIVMDEKIYNQINFMSSIPFQINKDVLNSILTYGVRYELIKDELHKKTLEMNALATEKDKKEFFAKLSSQVKQDMLTHNSQYYQQKNILGIAMLFEQVPQFYFPLFFDWRGRIYTDTSYLSFQGNELAKALLKFSVGKPLKNIFDEFQGSGEYWWKIYGANCYGLDKLSYEDRINWVMDNEKKIISLDPEFWSKAKEPFLFLAFCHEYVKFKKDPFTFVSHLPIQLDATCNGLQHLSVITANTSLAKLVNLLPSSSKDKPYDLYSVALDEIKKEIKKVIKKNPSYSRLANLQLDRAIVKRSIMTIPYNVTVNGIVEHLKDFFYIEKVENLNIPINIKEQDDKYLYIPKDTKAHGDKPIGGADLFKLAQIIYNSLYDTHPELKNVVSYFKEMVNLLTNLELPVVWITPGGLKIKQKYAKKKSTRVRSGLYKGADYTIVVPTDKIDKISQQSAFMPNLIHSLDGSTITLLIDKINKNNSSSKSFNLYTIHDCFATSASNIPLINELVREAFCEIYADEKFLHNLHEFFIEYIEGNYKINENFVDGPSGLIEIPKLPKTGDFKDLTENIKKAIYLIN